MPHSWRFTTLGMLHGRLSPAQHRRADRAVLGVLAGVEVLLVAQFAFSLVGAATPWLAAAAAALLMGGQADPHGRLRARLYAVAAGLLVTAVFGLPWFVAGAVASVGLLFSLVTLYGDMTVWVWAVVSAMVSMTALSAGDASWVFGPGHRHAHESFVSLAGHLSMLSTSAAASAFVWVAVSRAHAGERRAREADRSARQLMAVLATLGAGSNAVDAARTLTGCLVQPGWPLAHLFLIQDGRLASDVWAGQTDAYGAFVAGRDATTHTIGDGEAFCRRWYSGEVSRLDAVANAPVAFYEQPPDLAAEVAPVVRRRVSSARRRRRGARTVPAPLTSVLSSAVTLPDGTPVAVLAVYGSVAAQPGSAAALSELVRASREMLGQLFDREVALQSAREATDKALAAEAAAQDAVLVVDRAGAVQSWNAAAAVMFPRVARPGARIDAEQLLLGGLPGPGQQWRLRGCGVDGQSFPVLVRSSLWSAGAHPTRTLSVHDLSEREAANSRIAQLSQRSTTLLETVRHAVLEVSSVGLVTYVNAAGRALFACPGGDLVGCAVADLLPVPWDLLVSRSDGTQGTITTVVGSDGGRVPVEVVVAALPAANGDAGFVVTVWDLTDRERAQSAAVARDRLEQQRRYALELNDTVVQGLTVAAYATELGEHDAALAAVRGTLGHARSLVTTLLGDTDNLSASDLVRDVAAEPERPVSWIDGEEMLF